MNRRYPVGLEPVGERVTAESGSTSKSAVSRKLVKTTEHALADPLADLSCLDLVATTIDGVYPRLKVGSAPSLSEGAVTSVASMSTIT